MEITNFAVTGVTCGGCAGRVREAVGAVDGVAEVAVDVPAARFAVTSATALDAAAVIAAVEAAGYSASAV